MPAASFYVLRSCGLRTRFLGPWALGLALLRQAALLPAWRRRRRGDESSHSATDGCSPPPPPTLLCLNWAKPWAVLRAMGCHASQATWYRALYLLVSSYVWVAELEPLLLL